ncbi:MAG: toxic anion resistance protein [Oscillospiraceae bacterium]|nr:toxic anion resistance protein [Oscillospiraceae bacterium]
MEFSMETADAEKISTFISEKVALSEKQKDELKRKTEFNIEAIKKLDMSSLTAKSGIVKAIDSFGLDTMKRSAGQNTVLQSKFMGVNSLWGESSSIVAGLLSLRTQMKKLSPDDTEFDGSGFLGKLFNPVKAYFDKYNKAEESINEIMQTLDKGKSVLKNDNITLEIEEQTLKKITLELSQEIEFGTQMDNEISAFLDSYSTQISEEKREFITNEVLYSLKQRLFDLNQLMMVNQQGMVSLEILKKNNRELIRGIDRAQTVTLSVLRTAVLVAGSMYNQKLVLKKIKSLGNMTDSIMAGTSGILRQQGAQIGSMAQQSGNLSVQTLKAAFEDTFETLDIISGYKDQALDSMDEAIRKFDSLKNS